MIFPITPEMPRDLHRGILTPATMPDVFLQIGETRVYWTNYTRWYLLDWKKNQQWLHVPFLKQQQLEMISATALEGCVVYPLTHKAIEQMSMPSLIES